MGKKTKKRPRWRRLSLEDAEDPRSPSPGQSDDSGPARDKFRSRFQAHMARSHAVSTHVFDEDEYTKIQTPRQDMIFKKSAFAKKRIGDGSTPCDDTMSEETDHSSLGRACSEPFSIGPDYCAAIRVSEMPPGFDPLTASAPPCFPPVPPGMPPPVPPCPLNVPPPLPPPCPHHYRPPPLPPPAVVAAQTASSIAEEHPTRDVTDCNESAELADSVAALATEIQYAFIDPQGNVYCNVMDDSGVIHLPPVAGYYMMPSFPGGPLVATPVPWQAVPVAPLDSPAYQTVMRMQREKQQFQLDMQQPPPEQLPQMPAGEQLDPALWSSQEATSVDTGGETSPTDSRPRSVTSDDEDDDGEGEIVVVVSSAAAPSTSYTSAPEEVSLESTPTPSEDAVPTPTPTQSRTDCTPVAAPESAEKPVSEEEPRRVKKKKKKKKKKSGSKKKKPEIEEPSQRNVDSGVTDDGSDVSRDCPAGTDCSASGGQAVNSQRPLSGQTSGVQSDASLPGSPQRHLSASEGDEGDDASRGSLTPTTSESPSLLAAGIPHHRGSAVEEMDNDLTEAESVFQRETAVYGSSAEAIDSCFAGETAPPHTSPSISDGSSTSPACTMIDSCVAGETAPPHTSPSISDGSSTSPACTMIECDAGPVEVFEDDEELLTVDARCVEGPPNSEEGDDEESCDSFVFNQDQRESSCESSDKPPSSYGPEEGFDFEDEVRPRHEFTDLSVPVDLRKTVILEETESERDRSSSSGAVDSESSRAPSTKESSAEPEMPVSSQNGLSMESTAELVPNEVNISPKHKIIERALNGSEKIQDKHVSELDDVSKEEVVELLHRTEALPIGAISDKHGDETVDDVSTSSAPKSNGKVSNGSSDGEICAACPQVVVPSPNASDKSISNAVRGWMRDRPPEELFKVSDTVSDSDVEDNGITSEVSDSEDDETLRDDQVDVQVSSVSAEPNSHEHSKNLEGNLPRALCSNSDATNATAAFADSLKAGEKVADQSQLYVEDYVCNSCNEKPTVKSKWTLTREESYPLSLFNGQGNGCEESNSFDSPSTVSTLICMICKKSISPCQSESHCASRGGCSSDRGGRTLCVTTCGPAVLPAVDYSAVECTADLPCLQEFDEGYCGSPLTSPVIQRPQRSQKAASAAQMDAQMLRGMQVGTTNTLGACCSIQ